MNLAEAYTELFDGNREVQGTDGGSCRHVPWDVDRMEDHLNGAHPLGVYPMRPIAGTWVVKWGCVDIDEDDPPQAWNLQTALRTFDIQSYVERSRSKGYHVWVFASDWTAAWIMRRALLFACDVVGTTKQEVNPKQESLPQGAVGNYVRLPFPNEATARQVVLHRPMAELVQRLERAEFASLALMHRTSPDVLREVAELYVEPPAPVEVDLTRIAAPAHLIEDLPPLAKRIYYDGPLEGGDRSGALYKLAAVLRESGRFTAEEAFAIVDGADRVWGKYHKRADGQRRLVDLVASAYAGSEGR